MRADGEPEDAIMLPRSGWPLSELGLHLARSLLRDLAPLGYSLEIDADEIRYGQRTPASQKYREFYRDAHVKLHLARLREKLAAVRNFEEEYGPTVFIEGKDLHLAAITPQLRAVDLSNSGNSSSRDRAIVNYVRAYQTVGSQMSVGRENAFILEDVGHPNAPVMGVLILASPRYFQPRRDEVLGWSAPVRLRSISDAERERQKQIRVYGLRRMMHVAICCALPPYSHLCAAKLLAIAPLTGPVRDDFIARWKDHGRHPDRDPDLALVTTTSSMGITGTPYQNLKTTQLFDRAISAPRGAKWNADGKLYARLGDAHPWQQGVKMLSPETFANFEKLVSEETRAAAKTLVVAENLGGPNSKRAFNRALSSIGLNGLIFRGNPIGVFMGAVDRESIEAIAIGNPRQNRPILSWNLAVQKFRSDFGEAPDVNAGAKMHWRAGVKMHYGRM
jgi:hypothetical protein